MPCASHTKAAENQRQLRKPITELPSFTKRATTKPPSQNPQTPSAAAGPPKRRPMKLTKKCHAGEVLKQVWRVSY